MNPDANDGSRRYFLRTLSALGGAGIGGSLLLSACGGEATPNENHESAGDRERQAVEQINQIRREWERAENEGDPSIIDRHAADDVVAMPPDRPPVVGAEVGKKSLQRMFDRFDMEVEYTSEDVLVSGNLALDRMTFSQRLVPKDGGKLVESMDSSLWVYRHMSAGWKQILAIWNGNGSASS